MLNLSEFGQELSRSGFNFFTGVPCSFLKDLINYAVNHGKYVATANEGDAVAVASGVYLGGDRAVVLMQNSGLANAVSPLTSLNYTFQIPVLGFVSLRGQPGIQDEPQHELMGQITGELLTSMGVIWEVLASEMVEARGQLQRAVEYIDNHQCFFFVVKKNTFQKEELRPQQLFYREKREKVQSSQKDQLPTRFEALQLINQCRDRKTLQLAATGKTGRELYEIEDVPNNLYMVGSMGCLSSLGLGLALTCKDKEVMVIDGDGALLMRMGSMATAGFYHPANMLHILLDNQSHDSTGGQATVSPNVNFVDIAAACGYSRSVYLHSIIELKNAIGDWKKDPTLTFLYLKVQKGSKKDLGRPKVKPPEVKERFRQFIMEG